MATDPFSRTISRSASFSRKQTNSYAPSRASSFRELHERRTPGVAYRRMNKTNQKQQEEQPSSHPDKSSKRSIITTDSRITNKVSKRRNTTVPPPHLRQGDPEHLQLVAGDEPAYRLGRPAQ